MGDEGIGVGELSRQVRDVLVRFEGLVTRLETQFVTKENLAYYQKLIDQGITRLEENDKHLARVEKLSAVEDALKHKVDASKILTLEERIGNLEDDKQWITRLLIGFIILGVLGAAFAVYGVGGR